MHGYNYTKVRYSAVVQRHFLMMRGNFISPGALVINHCLFNVRKDLFGVLSGNILVTKNSGALPHINGIILIDRAQLTETLFSGVLHDAASHSAQGLTAASSLDATCDLEFLTYNPIRVNTVFLDAEARMNMHIKGHILEPSIAGSVSFESGRLIFPYRPLNITKAMLHYRRVP